MPERSGQRSNRGVNYERDNKNNFPANSKRVKHQGKNNTQSKDTENERPNDRKGNNLKETKSDNPNDTRSYSPKDRKEDEQKDKPDRHHRNNVQSTSVMNNQNVTRMDKTSGPELDKEIVNTESRTQHESKERTYPRTYNIRALYAPAGSMRNGKRAARTSTATDETTTAEDISTESASLLANATYECYTRPAEIAQDVTHFVNECGSFGDWALEDAINLEALRFLTLILWHDFGVPRMSTGLFRDKLIDILKNYPIEVQTHIQNRRPSPRGEPWTKQEEDALLERYNVEPEQLHSSGALSIAPEQPYTLEKVKDIEARMNTGLDEIVAANGDDDEAIGLHEIFMSTFKLMYLQVTGLREWKEAERFALTMRNVVWTDPFKDVVVWVLNET